MSPRAVRSLRRTVAPLLVVAIFVACTTFAAWGVHEANNQHAAAVAAVAVRAELTQLAAIENSVEAGEDFEETVAEGCRPASRR